MKKINIIKKEYEFTRIINSVKPVRTKSYVVFLEKQSNETVYLFGISVPKKLGNAVLRNKIKRQVKSIIDKKDYQKGLNCIIIIRKSYLENCYKENEKELIDIFKKLGFIKGEN